MSLFQKSVISKYLSNQDQEELSTAYKRFQKFYSDSERIENIKQLKEENYQTRFLDDIFCKVLGYTLIPDKNYNLTNEFKNETDSKKADGAILKDGKAIGVIELKSTKTVNLESITKQAFNYKNNQSKCKYVITSNFEKLNFYIDNATEWEEFNLFSLTEKDFALFYLLLNQKNLLNDVPFQIKKESRLHEENISDKLYKDYSQFKHKIYNNLVKNNPQYDKLVLFKKSQKLLDRVLFILFAEDSGLVPPNAISKIVDQYKQLIALDEQKSLYSRFIKFFNHLNVGHKYPDYSLPAYNGGLFKEDEILDNVHIDDEILLDDMLHLSEYDFSSEVDVNILGHIFEHSLTEIEELTAELEGTLVEREKSKRKRDGVFYTPKYITKYIVDNTIGALCKEKRKELNLDIIDETILENSKTTKGTLTKKAKELFENLDNYRKYVLSLKILDPACGSGAFLNQALEFLISEHRWIDEHKSDLLKEGFTISEYEKDIVEQNLFGVDINEEAVEIAKLSLWLRTAKKGRKLSTLSNNIKCGNSLIDDPEIAGEKAFNWNEEFKEIMSNGGFDVVIGNPPYVFGGNEGISSIEKVYFKENYQTGIGKVNLFTLFIEKSYFLLKNDAEFSFIIPNTFLRVTSYHESRKFLLNNFIFRELADLGNDVFQNAITTAIILFAKKARAKKDSFCKVIKDFSGAYWRISLNDIIKNKYLITSNLSVEKAQLLRKLNNEKIFLGHECREMIFGVVISKNKSDLVFDKQFDNYKPFLEGRDISSYFIKPVTKYLNYKPALLHRARTPKVFEVEEKLLVKRITGGERPLKVAYDNEGIYNKESINNIILKKDSEFEHRFILALLNSKLINWFYNNQFTNASKLTVNISKEYLSRIPVVLPQNQNVFIKKADLILILKKELFVVKEKYISRLKDNIRLDKITKRLDEFYSHSFKVFIGEIKKQKVELSLKQQDEWEDYFNEYKTEINQLQEQITKTDNEIDVMVYKLYNLTYDEVKIVDPNFFLSEEEYNQNKL